GRRAADARGQAQPARQERARPPVLRRGGPAAARAARGAAGRRAVRPRARRLRAGPHPVPATGPAAAGRLASRAAGPGPAGGRDRRHRRRQHPPHAARRAGARAPAGRRARGDHDARPRGRLRAVRRGPAAAAAAGQHRADRLGRQVDALRGPAGRRRARPGDDRPDHLPDRPARDHRQGPGRDRGRGRRRAAGRGGEPARGRGGGSVTSYAATGVDTPGDPFTRDPAAALAEDGALLVRDGVIRARGSLAEVTAAHPGEAITRLDGGLLLPGFVDTHVHFPQIRAIGGLGLPLLDWLERYALPEECKLADRTYARAVAGEFTDGLVASGTTSALVFGS